MIVSVRMLYYYVIGYVIVIANWNMWRYGFARRKKSR